MMEEMHSQVILQSNHNSYGLVPIAVELHVQCSGSVNNPVSSVLLS